MEVEKIQTLRDELTELEAKYEDRGRDFCRILHERNELKEQLAKVEKREKELIIKLQIAESKLKKIV